MGSLFEDLTSYRAKILSKSNACTEHAQTFYLFLFLEEQQYSNYVLGIALH